MEDVHGVFSGYSLRPPSSAGSDDDDYDDDDCRMSDADDVDNGADQELLGAAKVDAWDDKLHTVRPGLYLGSMRAEANLEALLGSGVTHILQVGEGLRPSHGDQFAYKQIYVDDDEREDLVAHFQKCFDFIGQAHSSPPTTQFLEHGGVLIHCAAGCSRSATVCLGYLMWKEKLSFDDAWRVVHAARPCICPNDGFKRQLFAFEKLESNPSKWRAWRHHSEEQDKLKRQITPSKMVLNRAKFCSLEVSL